MSKKRSKVPTLFFKTRIGEEFYRHTKMGGSTVVYKKVGERLVPKARMWSEYHLTRYVKSTKAVANKQFQKERIKAKLEELKGGEQ